MKADPEGVLRETKKILSERALVDFQRTHWHALEQGRRLVSGWALDAISEHLEAVANGEIKRLLINVPPAMTKSLTTCAFFPAWCWGPLNRPDMQFISCSYGKDLAVRNNGRMRDLIQSPIYQDLWGDRFRFKGGDDPGVVKFANDHGGEVQAASTLSTLTGYHGDIVLIDDPHSTESADSDVKRERTRRWLTETAPTRFNDQKTGAIIIIMQRLHTRDLSGLILSQDLGYEHLCLPMEYEPDHPHRSTRFVDPRSEPGELLFPERFPREVVDAMKKVFRIEGGTYAEAGQFQQRPAPRGGGMFKVKAIRIIEEAPSSDRLIGRRVVRGWDLAATKSERAAFTAGVKMGRLKTGEVVIFDVQRDQIESAEVYELMARVANQDGSNLEQSIPQDPGQAGKDQKRHIASHLSGVNVHFSTESGNKETRALGLAAQANAGNLVLVRAPWNDAFLAELESFPKGDWKDQVDGASRAYSRLLAKKSGEEVAAPKVFRG